MEGFIDDTDQQGEGVSFYRQLDLKILNTTINFLTRMTSHISGKRIRRLSCMLLKIDFAGFDKFAGFEKSVKKFRETLKNFDNSE